MSSALSDVINICHVYSLPGGEVCAMEYRALGGWFFIALVVWEEDCLFKGFLGVGCYTCCYVFMSEEAGQRNLPCIWSRKW